MNKGRRLVFLAIAIHFDALDLLFYPEEFLQSYPQPEPTQSLLVFSPVPLS